MGHRPPLKWAQNAEKEKKRTQPPPKENLLENFSGLEEKLSRPVVDTKSFKNQENQTHHRNLSSGDPIFFCEEKLCTGAGLYMVSFSQKMGVSGH